MPKTTGVTKPEPADGVDVRGLEVSEDFGFAGTDGDGFNAAAGSGECEIGVSEAESAFGADALWICVVVLSRAEFFNGDGLLDRAAIGASFFKTVGLDAR